MKELASLIAEGVAKTSQALGEKTAQKIDLSTESALKDKENTLKIPGRQVNINALNLAEDEIAQDVTTIDSAAIST